ARRSHAPHRSSDAARGTFAAGGLRDRQQRRRAKRGDRDASRVRVSAKRSRRKEKRLAVARGVSSFTSRSDYVCVVVLVPVVAVELVPVMFVPVVPLVPVVLPVIDVSVEESVPVVPVADVSVVARVVIDVAGADGGVVSV